MTNAEGLSLEPSTNAAGYPGVKIMRRSETLPFQASPRPLALHTLRTGLHPPSVCTHRLHPVATLSARAFQANLKRGGKNIKLGSFATAEEAALCYGGTPDAKAQRAHGRRLLAFAPWMDVGMTAEDALRAADAEELGQSSRPVAPSPA